MAMKATALPDYNITHFTNENGLPQNSIKGLEMDKHGFLWLITESGLVRFDGQRFAVYDKSQYPQLGNNRKTKLGLRSDSLVYWGDPMKLYTFNVFNQPVAAAYDIARPVFISQYQYDHFTQAAKKECGGANVWIDEHGEHENDIVSFRVKEISGGFLLVNRLDVLSVSGKRLNWRKRLQDCNALVAKCCGHLGEHFYYIDTGYNIRQAGRNGILNKMVLKGIDPALKVKERYPHQYALLQQEEQLYLLYGKGIYKLRETGAQELTAELMLETDIQGINVYRNYPGYNLQVVGSGTDGLYLFRKKQFKTYTFPNGAGNFYAQAPYGDSGILTTLGLIYPHASRLNYPFEMQPGRSLFLDQRGHYWVNKTDRHLKQWGAHITELDEHLKLVRTLRNQRVSRFWNRYVDNIECYGETPDGHIWMSAFGGQFLGRVEGDSLVWLAKTFPPYAIGTFLPLNNEEFWIGGSHTLMQLNVRTGSERHYADLEQYIIKALYLDRDHTLWISTEGDGFFALKKDKIYRFPTDRTGSLNMVHTFLEDKSGFMWMSTNNGLFRCSKTDMNHFIDGKTTYIYYQCFKKDAGFNTNEFNGSCNPAGVIFRDGKFSLPSLNGLVQFYPDSIKDVLPVNRIFIDKLMVDGRSQLLTGKALAIDPSFKFLEVQVSSPYWGNPINQSLEYRLAGLDNAWHPVNENNTIVLNNLTHGHYELQFRKHTGFGDNSIATTSISLSVKPFFYQTLYFKLAVLLVACLLIFAIVKLRYAYLMKRNRELEQEVASRTLHLNNANQLKEKMLLMVGHDLQSPLHFLGYLSDTNYEAVMAKQHTKAGLISQEMKNTSKKIYAFVDEFTLWARLQDAQSALKRKAFSIAELVREIDVFFKEILQLQHNTLEFTTEEAFDLYTNKELLKAILRNLVDNAQKHTRNGTISIHCSRDNEATCSIRVSDTGRGIPSAILGKIKDQVKRAGMTAGFEPGKKLGYQFIIDFTMRLGIHLDIESEENKGTTVLISGVTLNLEDQPVKKATGDRK
jgi:signal transduction histidine kinase